MSEKRTEPEVLDKASMKGATFDLCIKTESEAVIAKGLEKASVSTVKSESIETLAIEVIYKVPLTEVTSFSEPRYKERIAIGENKGALCSTTRLVEKGARSNLINKAHLRPHWKCRIERLNGPKLRTTTKELIKILGIILLTVEIGNIQVRT